jgi:UDP-glucose 4-epimerase
MPSPDGPIAVTGAAGYLGGRVVAALGTSARALLRAPVQWLPPHLQVTCDLLGPADDIARSLEGASMAIHLAGHNEVVAAEDPERALTETVAMADSLRSAAVAVGIRRIVYVSTIHVYGDQLRPGAVAHEDLEVSPTSAYARARAACEDVLRADAGVEAVVLRLSNAVGAPADPTVDRWTLVAGDLCRQAVLDRTMVLRSTGQQWRDFIVLEDACRLALATLEDRVAPGTYNLASGRPATVRSLAELIQDRVERMCGWRPGLEGPAPVGEPDEPYVIGTDGLGSLGLRAELPLEEGVDEIIDHCIKHEAALRDGAGR